MNVRERNGSLWSGGTRKGRKATDRSRDRIEGEAEGGRGEKERIVKGEGGFR
jgi:hypothetical protein